jgi:4-hydroxy-tetrahydrodipicolinate reductase
MGHAIAEACDHDDAVEIGAQIDVGDSLPDALEKCDAVIDFSFHTFTPEVAAACAASGKRLVIGTTGHSEQELDAIAAAAEKIPVCMAPNFSVGVNTLFWLTRKATEILGGEFDLEVVEMHHRLKVDAPSGTAKRLGEILAEASGVSYKEDTVHGREGIVGARTPKEIGMHSMRGGDVVGDHTVIYANVGERVELTHKASSRDTFAKGSVRAAKWLADKAPGMYDMQDVLGLQ